jgi:hypothetical protein
MKSADNSFDKHRLLAAVTSIGLALIEAPARLWIPVKLVAGAVGIIAGGGDDGWKYIRSR